jgi:hypothetical protein
LDKLRIYVIGLGKEKMDSGWPHHNFDVKSAMKKYKQELNKIGKSKGLDFSGYEIPKNEGEIIKIFDKIEQKEFDCILTISLTSEFASLGPSIFKIADIGLPTIVYTKPFSTYWDGAGKLYKGEYKVEVCDSEDIKDIIPILDILKAVAKLKRTRLLLLKDYQYDPKYYDPRMVEPRWLGPSYFRRLKDIFGIDIVRADSSDILKYYNQIEDMKAKNLASKFLESTQGILGTTEDEIIKATKLYLALKNLMEDYETNAVTAGCLPWIRQNLLPVSPCFAISKFNDEGIPAGCEADVESLITLCFCHYLAGRPGFMSDPVIDESTNRIIFAHCTASTRFLGYKQKPFPFWFRSHTESWRDVGIETEMKQKGEVTVLRLLGTIKSKSFCWPVVNVYNKFEGYNLLAYKAKTAEINKDIKDKEKRKLEWGCRTKVTLELPEEELRKFKENFYGHHRIILYGDYTKKLKMLARFLGIKFVNKMYLEFEI